VPRRNEAIKAAFVVAVAKTGGPVTELRDKPASRRTSRTSGLIMFLARISRDGWQRPPSHAPHEFYGLMSLQVQITDAAFVDDDR